MATSNGGSLVGKARAARFRKVLMYEEIGSPTLFPPGYHDYQRYAQKRWSAYEREQHWFWGCDHGHSKWRYTVQTGWLR